VRNDYKVSEDFINEAPRLPWQRSRDRNIGGVGLLIHQAALALVGIEIIALNSIAQKGG
jgi:hypothetical protein